MSARAHSRRKAWQIAHFGGIGFVYLAAVAHHGVDEHERAGLVFDERKHGADLAGAAEEAAVYRVEAQPLLAPGSKDFFHLAAEVEKGKVVEAARVGGQQRRRQRTDQMPVMGKHRPDRLHRAAAVAGNVMHGGDRFRRARCGMQHIVFNLHSSFCPSCRAVFWAAKPPENGGSGCVSAPPNRRAGDAGSAAGFSPIQSGFSGRRAGGGRLHPYTITQMRADWK